MEFAGALAVATWWATATVVAAALSRRLLAHWRNARRLRRSLRRFASPPCWPLIGNIHLVFGNGRGRVKKLLDMLLTYESPFVVWLAHIPMVILTKGEHIQTVSGKCVDRDMMGIFRESVGDGITVARAEKWRKTRRLMNPAFNASMLRQYSVVFSQQARLLVEKLADQADSGRQFDLWPYMANANVDIITENITGSKLNTQHTLENEFSRALIKTLQLESLRLVLPWLLSPSLFYLYRLLTGNEDVFRKLRTLPRQVLRRKNLERKLGSTHADAGVVCETNTLLDILLEARQTNPHFDEKQIHDEMLNVIVTGSESTAVTGSFVLLLLAMHPHVQERVYREVAAVFAGGRETAGQSPPADSRFASVDKLNELKFVEQCVKETLRIFTLFPLTIRKTTEQIKLDDELTIPADCQVAMALHGVHLDPLLYPKPTVWNPDNFEAAAVEKRPKYAFLAFGSGPRSCIGTKYAVLSLKAQIARVVLAYRLETDVRYTDLRPVMDAIVRNKFGYPVRLRSRERGAPLDSGRTRTANAAAEANSAGGATRIENVAAAHDLETTRRLPSEDTPDAFSTSE